MLSMHAPFLWMSHNATVRRRASAISYEQLTTHVIVLDSSYYTMGLGGKSKQIQCSDPPALARLAGGSFDLHRERTYRSGAAADPRTGVSEPLRGSSGTARRIDTRVRTHRDHWSRCDSLSSRRYGRVRAQLEIARGPLQIMLAQQPQYRD